MALIYNHGRILQSIAAVRLQSETEDRTVKRGIRAKCQTRQARRHQSMQFPDIVTKTMTDNPDFAYMTARRLA
jgi:hypothetical protein